MADGMSGMAEVLAAHQHAYSLVTVSDPHSECSCGEVTPINIPGGWNPGCTSAFVESQRVASHTAHQAAMLTAAGFGPVKESAQVTEAQWQEVAELADPIVVAQPYTQADLREAAAVALEEAADDYRHYETPNARLYLRARAAAVRGEG